MLFFIQLLGDCLLFCNFLAFLGIIKFLESITIEKMCIYKIFEITFMRSLFALSNVIVSLLVLFYEFIYKEKIILIILWNLLLYR